MSTTGHDVQLRWIDDAPPARRSARALIAAALLCPAVFACFFAVGRTTIATHTSPAATVPNLPITYAGAPIPARLREAPPLDAIGAPPAHAATRPHRATGPAKTTPPAAAQVVQSAAPSSPTTAFTPPPAAAKAPTPATTTPPAHHSQPQNSGGVSFDSSG